MGLHGVTFNGCLYSKAFAEQWEYAVADISVPVCGEGVCHFPGTVNYGTNCVNSVTQDDIGNISKKTNGPLI